MTTITVYTRGDAFRVVRGGHKQSEMLKGGAVRTYDDARAAYYGESDASIRAAVLRIDPTANSRDDGRDPSENGDTAADLIAAYARPCAPPARKDLQHPDAGPRGERYPFGDPQS